MSKIAKILLIAVAVLAIVELGFLGFMFLHSEGPYELAENSMPADGAMTLTQKTDGSLELQWPAGQNADCYTVSILDTATGENLFSRDCGNTLTCTVPALSSDREVTIRVTSGKHYQKSAGSKARIRPGNEPLEAATTLNPPSARDLKWNVNTSLGILNVHMNLAADETCQMRYQGEFAKNYIGGDFSVAFGRDGGYPLPALGEKIRLTFEVCRKSKGLTFVGLPSGEISLDRDALLATAIHLQCHELGNNTYKLEWNPSRGEHYEVQMLDTASGQWKTVHTIPWDGERSYTTSQLARFRKYEFRVIARGKVLLPGSAYAAEPGQVKFTTGATALYSTIWPLHPLDVYQDTAKTQVLTKVPEGKAFCVIGVVDNLFKIRTDKGEGYVDSNYCMVNLPEYLGDICSYDITNSYDSLYMVHEYGIGDVTGTVVSGYEHVKMQDGKYLVPLLYPTAKKLVDAAISANKMGYRLKIYDSFRPKQATRSIYDITNLIINNPIPPYTANGQPGVNLPAVTPGTVLTYGILMTDNGRYSLGHFLARVASNHNIGIAMDLTLEKLYSKEELQMQTRMHDLSWYSETSQNNTQAKILEQIMTGAGFGGLESEWWHYQDNEAKATLGLKHLWTGVTPECWMKNDRGWRYRTLDGSFLTGCTKVIDGVSYTFDGSGYAK